MILECFIVFVVAFVVILFLKRRKYFDKKKFNRQKFIEDVELLYLKDKYKININTLNPIKAIFTLSIANSLCISISYGVFNILPIDSYMVKLVLLFCIIVILIIILYYFVSLILKKR